MTTAEAVGETLYEARIRLGMRQVDMARACHITQTTVSHYERGGVADDDILSRMMYILGVPYGTFWARVAYWETKKSTLVFGFRPPFHKPAPQRRALARAHYSRELPVGTLHIDTVVESKIQSKARV